MPRRASSATAHGMRMAYTPPSPPSPIATLPCGALLQGSMVPAIADGFQPVASYRGVPYAQPPVGAKRWMPPETLACPAAPGETLDVSKTPRSCWQSDGAATTCGKRNMTTSEDCLTVDIYVQPKLVGASPSVPLGRDETPDPFATLCN